jgi:hypothetical protein
MWNQWKKNKIFDAATLARVEVILEEYLTEQQRMEALNRPSSSSTSGTATAGATAGGPTDPRKRGASASASPPTEDREGMQPAMKKMTLVDPRRVQQHANASTASSSASLRPPPPAVSTAPSIAEEVQKEITLFLEILSAPNVVNRIDLAPLVATIRANLATPMHVDAKRKVLADAVAQLTKALTVAPTPAALPLPPPSSAAAFPAVGLTPAALPPLPPVSSFAPPTALPLPPLPPLAHTAWNAPLSLPPPPQPLPPLPPATQPSAFSAAPITSLPPPMAAAGTAATTASMQEVSCNQHAPLVFVGKHRMKPILFPHSIFSYFLFLFDFFFVFAAGQTCDIF